MSRPHRPPVDRRTDPDGVPLAPAPGDALAQPARRRWMLALAGVLGGAGTGLLQGCGGGDAAAGTADAAATGAGTGVAATDGPSVQIQRSGVDGGGTGVRINTWVSAVVSRSSPLVCGGIGFGVAAADIRDDDGQVLAATALLPGTNPRIEATRLTGAPGSQRAEAVTVRLGEQLLGLVQAVDVSGASVQVLGQTVRCTAATVWDAGAAGGLAALRAGQWLRVWGQPDTASGRVVATRVALADAASAPAWVLRGVVTAIDAARARLWIGTQALQLPAAQAAAWLAAVAVGGTVRARLDTALAADGSAVVQTLRTDDAHLPEQLAVELDGRISAVAGAQQVWVDGLPVDLSAVRKAGDAALPLSQRVQVSGRVQAGVLRAQSLVLEDDEPVELEGLVASPDAGARRFTVAGVVVHWDEATVFEGGGAVLLTPRRAVAVVGRWNADRSAVIATRVHVEA